MGIIWIMAGLFDHDRIEEYDPDRMYVGPSPWWRSWLPRYALGSGGDVDFNEPAYWHDMGYIHQQGKVLSDIMFFASMLTEVVLAPRLSSVRRMLALAHAVVYFLAVLFGGWPSYKECADARKELDDEHQT